MDFWRQPRRGFVTTGSLGRTVTPDDAYFRGMAETGARLTRVFLHMTWDPVRLRYAASPMALSALGDTIRRANAFGLSLVLVGDFESAPNPPLWGDPFRAKAFAQAWRRLAVMLRDVSCIAGYDLLNEPNPTDPLNDHAVQRAEWVQVLERTIEEIRAEDTRMPLIIEGIHGGMPIGLRSFPVLKDPRIVYSVHMYNPHAITHQHVSAGWSRTLPYPVDNDQLLRGTDAFPGPWNISRLRMVFADTLDLQRRSGAPVFVGEFSCARWAPGESSLNYIRDCLTLFKEFGWSWVYHEFRGWSGWDAEIDSRNPSVTARSANAPVMRLIRGELNAGGGRAPS